MTEYKLARGNIKNNKPAIKPIGLLIQEIRKSQNMTLYQLAKKSHISYTTLQYMELGKKANFEFVEKIATVLGVPLETFSVERRKIIESKS